MSRQTDLSAFIAKKMNKNPQENDNIQPSNGKQRTGQVRSSPSLLFQFKSNKKGNNSQNSQASNVTLKPQNERSNSKNQHGKSKNEFFSSSLTKTQDRPKHQLSIKRVQSILGVKNKQNVPYQLQKQIQKVEDISEDTLVIQEDTYALQVVQSSKLSPVNTLKCPVFVLIGPFDTIFADTIEDDLELLMQQCNKQKVIQFIKKQTIAQATNNLDLLQKINDEEFWCETMQTVVQLLQKNKRCLIGGIRTLPYTGLLQSTTLTRLQVFLIVCSMFLCLIPKQSFCELTSFIELMTLRAGDAKLKQKSPMRLQKLKCVINYMKLMCRNQSIYEEKIIFQRVVKYDYEYLAEDRNKHLLNATVLYDKIESGYCRGAMVDFSNKAVGGGFLTNGCAQQQILFSIFPQLSIIKLICEELRDQQALVIKGARKFNLYSGYSHSFKFQGSYQHFQDSSFSTIVAVDAVDYSAKLSKASQYTKKFLRRQLHKMYMGIQGACLVNNFQLKKVFTGKWGCGVFKGDQYIKFCVQWMVCSELGLQMNFMHEEAEKVGELRAMVKQLQGRPVSDLLGLMEQYGKMGKFSDKGLLKYLKEYS